VHLVENIRECPKVHETTTRSGTGGMAAPRANGELEIQNLRLTDIAENLGVRRRSGLSYFVTRIAAVEPEIQEQSRQLVENIRERS